MFLFEHQYPYDPSYGYNLEDLFRVSAPKTVDGFVAFWQRRYQNAIALAPEYKLAACGNHAGFQIYDLSYQSTNGIIINGWVLIPEHQEVKQGIIVGHGYGGREQPDYHLNIPNTAFLFPCFRGLSRSRCQNLPERPDLHILYGINSREDYILGGCVEDLWLAVTVMLKHFPQTHDHIGYMGISFGGGIGALALPWDKRIHRGHFNVPTFGNHPLRLALPTAGSAASVKHYSDSHQDVQNVLSYYDAAVSASYANQTAHFALAKFDPVVAPPGQFAIYNAWAGNKSIFVLDAGHFDYPNRTEQEQKLIAELQVFFGEISN